MAVCDQPRTSSSTLLKFPFEGVSKQQNHKDWIHVSNTLLSSRPGQKRAILKYSKCDSPFSMPEWPKDIRSPSREDNGVWIVIFTIKVDNLTFLSRLPDLFDFAQMLHYVVQKVSHKVYILTVKWCGQLPRSLDQRGCHAAQAIADRQILRKISATTIRRTHFLRRSLLP